jgi:hypothetical protein
MGKRRLRLTGKFDRGAGGGQRFPHRRWKIWQCKGRTVSTWSWAVVDRSRANEAGTPRWPVSVSIPVMLAGHIIGDLTRQVDSRPGWRSPLSANRATWKDAFADRNRCRRATVRTPDRGFRRAEPFVAEQSDNPLDEHPTPTAMQIHVVCDAVADAARHRGSFRNRGRRACVPHAATCLLRALRLVASLQQDGSSSATRQRTRWALPMLRSASMSL